MVQWLNTNAGAIAGAAALISAAATLAVAFFSFGTWRLYRLELRRERAALQEFETRCDFLWIEFSRVEDSVRGHARGKGGTGKIPLESLDRMHPLLAKRIGDLRDLYSRAAYVRPSALAALSLALMAVEHAAVVFAELLDPDHEGDRSAQLQDAANALGLAGDSLVRARSPNLKETRLHRSEAFASEIDRLNELRRGREEA
jgi:hypothetical protein